MHRLNRFYQSKDAAIKEKIATKVVPTTDEWILLTHTSTKLNSDGLSNTLCGSKKSSKLDLLLS